MDLPMLQGLPNRACNTSSSPGQLIHRQLMGKHQNGRGVTWISLKLGFGAFQLSESPHNTQILLIKVKFCSNNNTWIHHLSLSGCTQISPLAHTGNNLEKCSKTQESLACICIITGGGKLSLWSNRIDPLWEVSLGFILEKWRPPSHSG